MLPHGLATGPFSLRLGHTCCAFSIGIVLDTEGGISECVITPSTVKVTQRMSFDQVGEVLADAAQLPAHPELVAFHQVSFAGQLQPAAVKLHL